MLTLWFLQNSDVYVPWTAKRSFSSFFILFSILRHYLVLHWKTVWHVYLLRRVFIFPWNLLFSLCLILPHPLGQDETSYPPSIESNNSAGMQNFPNLNSRRRGGMFFRPIWTKKLFLRRTNYWPRPSKSLSVSSCPTLR